MNILQVSKLRVLRMLVCGKHTSLMQIANSKTKKIWLRKISPQKFQRVIYASSDLILVIP